MPRPTVLRVADVRIDERLLVAGRRWREVLLLSALTGAIVGLLVAGFEWVTAHQLLPWLFGLPLALQAAGPVTGLLVCALALRYLARGAGPATSDEYIRLFHQPDRHLDLRAVPGRLLGSVATLGLGGALGLEGPSVYLGAATGSAIQRRIPRLFSPGAGKVLMVAGAAAGVAAIFKAPITGTVFALEVPFRDDTARRMLVPASVASAAGYVVFASINGTAPLFPTEESPALGWRELGGGLVVGLLCGLAARLFTVVIRKAKQLQARLDPPVRIGAAGALLAAIFAAGHLLTGESLTLGPGYNVVEWLDGSPSVGLVAAVLVLRTVATAATLAGGGAGGVFIPLVLFGMLTGHVVGGAIDGTAATLFPLVGVAAFLGAGYRTPLAAVVFVAESTGQAGFVVPALLAAAVSQLVMGRASVSPYQETGELGHVERRLQLPLAAALRPDVPTASPHLSLQELLGQHLVSARNQGVAVATDGRYLGIVRWEDVHQVPPDQWTTTTLADILRTDLEVASPDWQLEQAVEAMHAAHLDMLPVVTDRRELVGVVTLDDVVRLEDLLPDTTTGPA